MNFRTLLLLAKSCNEYAVNELIRMYRPLLINGAMINGTFDEDLFQEQCITLLRCIELFRI